MSAHLFAGYLSSSEHPLDSLIGSCVLVVPFALGRFDLDVPVNGKSLEYIEDTRNGKDLDLSVRLQAMVAVRGIGSGAPQGIDGIDGGEGQSSFTIPRSHWVDHVLPGLGYLSHHLLEMAVPTQGDLAEPFQRSLKEIADAEDKFRRDDYDGVIVDCRNAVDALVSAYKLDLGEGPASFSNRLKAFREQRLAERLSGTKAQLVVEELEAMWKALSAPTKPGSFVSDRLTAKYVLQSTVNVLSYVGKLLSA